MGIIQDLEVLQRCVARYPLFEQAIKAFGPQPG